MKCLRYFGKLTIVAGVFLILGAIGYLERGGTISQVLTSTAIGMIMTLIGFMLAAIGYLRS